MWAMSSNPTFKIHPPGMHLILPTFIDRQNIVDVSRNLQDTSTISSQRLRVVMVQWKISSGKMYGIASEAKRGATIANMLMHRSQLPFAYDVAA